MKSGSDPSCGLGIIPRGIYYAAGSPGVKRTTDATTIFLRPTKRKTEIGKLLTL